MNTKTAGLITLVWLILQILYLLTIALDAGTFAVLTWQTITTTTVNFVFWSSVTVLLYKLIEKPVINRNYFLLIIIFLSVFSIFQPIKTVIVSSLSGLYTEGLVPDIVDIFLTTPFILYYLNFTQYIFVFCMCLGLIHNKNASQMKLTANELEKKAAKAELNLSDMKMHVLQNQLSPHFLFNSLNSISGLIRIEDKNKSLDSIASLGDLLRLSLNASSSSFISLAEEIEFTTHYVDLQRLRFNEFFNFKLEYNESLNQLQCPPFLLQTLIENAFTHAVANKKNTINIDAKITKNKGHLDFTIENTLPNDGDETKIGNGLALKNLETRLDLLYSGTFLIEQITQKNTYSSKVQIPLSEKIYNSTSDVTAYDSFQK